MHRIPGTILCMMKSQNDFEPYKNCIKLRPLTKAGYVGISAGAISLQSE